MRLKAVDGRTGIASLDVMTQMVYHCAKSHKTIGETAATCGLDGDLTRRIVKQLMDMNLVTADERGESKPSQPARSSVPRASTTSAREAQRKFNAFEDTETFVEKLESLFSSCKTENFYDLLDVDPDTPRAELRKRYFELSKRFHPDKAFLQEAKERKDKMAFIFQRLTLAYETLSNPKKRKAYNQTIAEQLEFWMMERNLKAAVAGRTIPPERSSDPAAFRSEPPVGARISEKPFQSEPPAGERVSKKPSVDPKRESATSVPADSSRSSRPSISGARSVSSPARPSAVSVPSDIKRFRPSSTPSPQADIRRKELKRRLAGRAMADLLSRRSVVPPTNTDINKSLREAELAMEQERFADAANITKTILKQFPDHERAAVILKSAGEGLSQVQARLHIRRGRYAVKDGQPDQAKWHFEQALVIDKDNIEARHLLADLILDTERNAERALSLMKEVIVLGGKRARYFATLGDIFMVIEDFERAADAFRRALKLEPENRELKKKLKLCTR